MDEKGLKNHFFTNSANGLIGGSPKATT